MLYPCHFSTSLFMPLTALCFQFQSNKNFNGNKCPPSQLRFIFDILLHYISLAYYILAFKLLTQLDFRNRFDSSPPSHKQPARIMAAVTGQQCSSV